MKHRAFVVMLALLCSAVSWATEREHAHNFVVISPADLTNQPYVRKIICYPIGEGTNWYFTVTMNAEAHHANTRAKRHGAYLQFWEGGRKPALSCPLKPVVSPDKKKVLFNFDLSPQYIGRSSFVYAKGLGDRTPTLYFFDLEPFQKDFVRKVEEARRALRTSPNQ